MEKRLLFSIGTSGKTIRICPTGWLYGKPAMGKFTRIIGIAVAAMFFLLGAFVLLSSRFSNLPKEARVIFAVFLFLYGAYRMVRYIYKDRDEEEE